MKPLQHAQISAKTHRGCWTDYIEVHSFLDSSKATCAHFKHRFLLHHVEGIELGAKIFGEAIRNNEGREVSTRKILTEHLIEDVGRIVAVEDRNEKTQRRTRPDGSRTGTHRTAHRLLN